MALTSADKTWLRKMVKAEIDALLKDMVAGQQLGGYDGATPVVDDDDYGSRHRKRVGF